MDPWTGGVVPALQTVSVGYPVWYWIGCCISRIVFAYHLSGDEADLFEEQHSKKKTHYFNVNILPEVRILMSSVNKYSKIICLHNKIFKIST